MVKDRRGSVQGAVRKKGIPARLDMAVEAWKRGHPEECRMDPRIVHGVWNTVRSGKEGAGNFKSVCNGRSHFGGKSSRGPSGKAL